MYNLHWWKCPWTEFGGYSPSCIVNSENNIFHLISNENQKIHVHSWQNHIQINRIWFGLILPCNRKRWLPFSLPFKYDPKGTFWKSNISLNHMVSNSVFVCQLQVHSIVLSLKTRNSIMYAHYLFLFLT